MTSTISIEAALKERELLETDLKSLEKTMQHERVNQHLPKIERVRMLIRIEFIRQSIEYIEKLIIEDLMLNLTITT